MENCQIRTPFLNIVIKKSDKTVSTNIYSKPTNSKRYISFTSNKPLHFLTNIPFSVARGICIILKKKVSKENIFKNCKKPLLEQDYRR